MADTYTVVKGDTLSEIAEKFFEQYGGSGTYSYMETLVGLNNIKDPDRIVVGQTIKLTGTVTTQSANTTSRATIDVFGLQSNTDRTMYATWTWSKANTDCYQVMWYYDTGDGVWFIGNNSTVDDNQSIYNAPSNAKKVKFKVKPISKTRRVNNTETSYWTAGWSTEKSYDFSNNPPTAPGTPTVKIEKYTLTATLDNLDINATDIQFQIVKDNNKVFKTGTAKIVTGHASFSCSVNAGSEYKVRCRSHRDGMYSGWSDYSNNEKTIPSVPAGITELRATSESSVYLAWSAVNSATSYDIQYTTKKEYFDGSDQVKESKGIEFTHFELSSLETGEEYFFRVCASNSIGSSGWSDIKSIVIGKDPVAPTTWSSTTTAITGETLNLYWVHNTEDGSSQTFAELELIINGEETVHTIKNDRTEEEKDKTSVYTIDTSPYVEGTVIQWRVRTAGITKVYGDWSVQRTVDVYAPPTLELNLIKMDGTPIEVLEEFPCYVSALAGPNTQVPTGYHVTVTSNEYYETTDNMGNEKIVNAGDAIYSKYFDINTELMVELSAGNINLDNNIHYTVTCVASMNSGLTATSSVDFTVSWTDNVYEPNAEIGIDEEVYAAYIRPYCEDEYGVPIEGITLSVYRREFDGGFTELAVGLVNSSDTYITDPHPALDLARYRVVATTDDTGAISYYDVPGYPVGGKAVIIQWDEDWSSFNTLNEDPLEQPTWSGSMLKLPYNIDVSNSNSVDAELIEYIGRSHPVSYYGTQVGETATWNVEIDKTDKETLYGLRRLSVWMGDVYVREPSGSGYWANISVSFNQKHLALTIPVTLNVTRVSGGI